MAELGEKVLYFYPPDVSVEAQMALVGTCEALVDFQTCVPLHPVPLAWWVWVGGWMAMDGWMGGWVDGHGWVDGWMGGWVDGWMAMGGWVDGHGWVAC